MLSVSRVDCNQEICKMNFRISFSFDMILNCLKFKILVLLTKAQMGFAIFPHFFQVLPSSVKLAIAIATEVAL